MAKVNIIIPALNEEDSLPYVLKDLNKQKYDIKVIVCDNGSTDRTPQVAKSYGATVVFEKHKGYGSACLKGMSVIDNDAEVIVFIDADYADDPKELPLLIYPILSNKYDFVLGARNQGKEKQGALPPQAKLGNFISTVLIKLIWGRKYNDLGPFRSIRYTSLKQINMQDKNFGWTIEMQIKALQHKMRILEIPVSYRKRIAGTSKITSNPIAAIKATLIILYTILKHLC